VTEPIRYRVRYVDGSEPDMAYRIMRLHRECFGFSAPLTAPWDEDTWVAYQDDDAVGFATLQDWPEPGLGYLARAGVIKEHRGHGLQRRLIRARERRARQLGYTRLVSDTTDNPASARSLQRCGYSTFEPKYPWGPYKTTLYWEKHL
jgi:GNAT superfamily N-acetyltransferase